MPSEEEAAKEGRCVECEEPAYEPGAFWCEGHNQRNTAFTDHVAEVYRRILSRRDPNVNWVRVTTDENGNTVPYYEKDREMYGSSEPRENVDARRGDA